MTLRTLIWRSLCFHWRGQLGVLLGATVGSAALIGALVVGDSVRESLRELALQRLGWIHTAMAPADRFFTQALEQRLDPGREASLPERPGYVAAALTLPGTAARQDGTARANPVQVLGVTTRFWGPATQRTPGAIPVEGALINEALAARLRARVGDAIVLRVHKPSALSRDIPITPQSDASVALRMRVQGVVAAGALGNFSLRAGQVPPLNAFVRLEDLQAAAELPGKANLLLTEDSQLSNLGAMRQSAERSPEPIAEENTTRLASPMRLADFGLELRVLTNTHCLELRTDRIFLDPAAPISPRPPFTNAQPLLTYLVNQIRAGDRMTPYSMVTAAGLPWTPQDLREDEVVVNEWLATDLRVGVGDSVQLAYFLPESGSSLVERTNTFRIRSIVPLDGLHGDRTLMPDFPGLAKAESTHDWDAGFPLVHKLREVDEHYWKEHRGTPKAFITLAAGQKLWGNRFGNLTAIRFPVPAVEDLEPRQTALENELQRTLDPTTFGLGFVPVREQALSASAQSQDFGGLFLGFSLFLILAALILMALLFQFGVEQRTVEIGTLLALGFPPAQVRRLLLGEGVLVALAGGMLGVAGGLGYARIMIQGLTTLWRDAVGTSALQFHVTKATLAAGLAASVTVCVVTIALVLRKQARQPARVLLAAGGPLEPIATKSSKAARPGAWARSIAAGAGLIAAALIGWALFKQDSASADIFFGAGALLLIALLAAVAVLLSALGRSEATRPLSLAGLGLRGCTRRRSRSLACVALLACGSFLIVAVGANRLEAGRDATRRSSGTGGFAWLGESTLPVVRDLNTTAGREFYGLDAKLMDGVSVVPFRVRAGDDASCLNLNRAQTPRLLGVNPRLLSGRNAFTFVGAEKGLDVGAGWELLRREKVQDRLGPDEIAAIGDAASIQWALGRKLGDAIDYNDEHGRKFKVRLVAAVANSVLQGNLLIDEAEFVRRFPGESGHRMFLVDVPSKAGSEAGKIAAELSRALQDAGLALVPATRRLAEFNAVQNTYLNTFQVLGGLGLLLGSAGLGVVVLRNVLERRGELGLLQAVGFRRRAVRWLVLSEHGALLGLGVGVGMLAALAAILPVILAPGASIHYTALVATLAGVLGSGLIWTSCATWLALRGGSLDALRDE